MSAVATAHLAASADLGAPTVVVAPCRDLGGEVVRELERFLRSLEPLPDIVVLDLGDVRHVDAAGLRLLAAEHDRAEAEGRRLVLIRVRSGVMGTLRLVGLDDVLPVAPVLGA